METCKSPRTVLLTAYQVGTLCLPEHTDKFSRHDFTLAQLFACLVLREFCKLSYRKTEALLKDSVQWCLDIGLAKTPDHNTLWRAFGFVTKLRHINRMLDLLARLFEKSKLLKLCDKPAAMDSTCFERHHRSRHYDRRCRRMALRDGEKYGKKPGKWGKSVNAARSRQLKKMPKLAIAVASACHLILAATVRIGNRSDAPDFVPLLRQACGRAKVKVAVADSGYDSEANHRIARQEMKVRSIIYPGTGRPTDKPPTGRWRRHMVGRFARKADARWYGQRAQSETTHSMYKRNLGDALRSRLAGRCKGEMRLRVVTHNIMLAASG